MKWTQTEIELLYQEWPTATTERLLSKFPNRTYKSISEKARKLNISSNDCRRRKGDLSFLELANLTKETAYWWGFIMADGHLSKRGTLTIAVDETDSEYLNQLATKLGVTLKLYFHKNSNRKLATVSVTNVNIVKRWFSILKMTETAKTYFPPDLSLFLNKDWLIYFLIGFIDGDGCLTLSYTKEKGTRKNLTITNHASWYDNWIKIKNKCFEYYNINMHCTITNYGYVRIGIYDADSHMILLNHLNQLPYMKRKWDKFIDYYNNGKYIYSNNTIS